MKRAVATLCWKHRGWITFILAFLLYAPSISYDYTLDDAIVIYDNEFTTDGLSGIPSLFSYDTFRGFFKEEGKDKLVAGGRYRPLTPALFAIEYSLVGEKPWLSHLINVLLFALLCVFVISFTEKLLPPVGKSPRLFILFTVALFAVHPIHTEVVANIKGRDEILSMLLGILALLKLADNRRLLAGVFFFLALLSKEMALTWMVVGWGFFWIIKKEGFFQSLRSLIPLMIAFVGYLFIRISVLGWPMASEPIMELMNNPFIKIQGSHYVLFSWDEKIASIAYTLYNYVSLLLFPHPLTHDYYPRMIPITGLSNIRVLLGLSIHIAMLNSIFYFKKTKPVLSFGLFFYLASLLLIANIFFPIGTHMGERFVFMASLGLVIVLAYVLTSLHNKHISKVLFAVILLGYMIKTSCRLPAWKDDYTLFTTDVITSNRSAKALNAAAGSLVDRCIASGPDCDPDAIHLAEKYLQKALALHPNYTTAHLILGNVYFIQKNYDEALAQYKGVLELDPNQKDAEKNLMLSYIEASKYWGEKKGDVDRALRLLLEAQKRDAENIEILRLLGVAHGVKGNHLLALEYFEKVLKKDPENSDALRNVGIALIQLGRKEEGEKYIKQAERKENEK